MKVFKFGGASVNSVDRIKNIGEILNLYAGENLVVIISAIGKTTNALEKVVEAFYSGDKETAISLFDVVKKQHIDTAKYLLVTNFNACLAQLNDFFTEPSVCILSILHPCFFQSTLLLFVVYQTIF
ncbi:MAG: hypothetical protein ABJA79_06210 [Parafilimonas sp.]